MMGRGATSFLLVGAVGLGLGCLRSEVTPTAEVTPPAMAQESVVATPVAQAVRWVGRVDVEDRQAPRFSWSHSGFIVRVWGTGLHVTMSNEGEYLFRARVDGKLAAPFQVEVGRGTYVVASDLDRGEHTIEVYRETEGQYGVSALLALGGARVLPPPPARERRIEIVGDSIAAGYGLLAQEHHAPELHDGCGYTFATQSAVVAYGGKVARELDADLSIVAHSGWGVVRDVTHDEAANVPSLYDRTLADRSFPAWSSSYGAQFVVIHLGTNDFAGPPDSDPGERKFVAAYTQLARRTRQRHPQAWILCVIGPLLTDSSRPDVKALSASREYVSQAIALRAADGDSRVALVEFPHADLSITACDWHPNEHEHQRMADALVGAIRERSSW